MLQFHKHLLSAYITLYPTLFILLLLSAPSSSLPNQNLDICDRIFDAITAKNKTELKDLIETAEGMPMVACFLELTPRYYWAQNMTHLMLKFQFLNSADTSACDRVLSVQKEVNHDSFAVSLICVQSNMILRYRVKIVTFMALNYYHALWKQGQQSTIYLECMKSPSPYFWKQLHQDNHEPQSKPKVWWELVEKYQEELKDFLYQLEVGEGQQDISGYVRHRRALKGSEIEKQYDGDSDIYFYCNNDRPFQAGSWIV